jgi:hypothetical protein
MVVTPMPAESRRVRIKALRLFNEWQHDEDERWASWPEIYVSSGWLTAVHPTNPPIH